MTDSTISDDEWLALLEHHAREARARGDLPFAESLEADASRMRMKMKGHADA